MSDQVVAHKTCEVDGKAYAFTNITEFFVQVGKGCKGSYKTERVFTGDLYRAVQYFAAINVGNGYKKRICCNGKVWFRKLSE